MEKKSWLEKRLIFGIELTMQQQSNKTILF